MPAPLGCLGSMATRKLLAELAAAKGIQVSLTAIGGVEAARRVRAGELTDVVVLASRAMQALADDGHILPGSLAPVVVSGMAVAVRSDAASPDISTADAMRAAMLACGRVAYSTGPSGDHLLRLVDKWGIQTQMQDRLIQAPPGVPVARLIADGEADIGFQQLSELLDQPGIAVIGPLPPVIQSATVFTAGILRISTQPDAARALIEAFTAADADATKRKHGMAPGRL